jgi:hypothetical protein
LPQLVKSIYFSKKRIFRLTNLAKPVIIGYARAKKMEAPILADPCEVVKKKIILFWA